MVGGEWTTLFPFEGGPGAALGSSFASAGDLSGEGLSEILVGAPGSAAGPPVAGSVQVRSGATGVLYLEVWGAIGDEFGASVAALGDVDGDGVPDWIAGAPGAAPGGLADAGQAWVYSGATGLVLWGLDGPEAGGRFGAAVAGAGDGDGLADFAVAAPDAAPGGLPGAGRVSLYSGATGLALWSLDGLQVDGRLGHALAYAGDRDGDGRADLLVGEPGAAPGGLAAAGRVLTLTGLDGTEVQRTDGAEAGAQLGWAVASAGDLNYDGLADALLGAPGASPGGLMAAGAAYLRAGGGALIGQVDGVEAGARLGSAVAVVGDQDGDSRPDLLLGAPEAEVGGAQAAGYAGLYAGGSGALLWRFDGALAGDRTGAAVGVAGELSGDRTLDFLVGAPGREQAGVAGSGFAELHSLDPYFTIESWKLSVTAVDPIRLEVNFPETEARKGYLVLASLLGVGVCNHGGIDIPLVEDGNLLRLLSGWQPPVIYKGSGPLDPNGDSTAFMFGHHMLNRVIGQRIYLAVVSIDPETMLGRLSSSARSLRVVY